MKILFIGNFQTGPGGEAADETHLVRELRLQGHVVTQVPRDEWREYVIEGEPVNKYKVPENEMFDIAIICKWHHFYDEGFINLIKLKYKCSVFYWCWDWMNEEEWHIKMAKAADLYLSGELGSASVYRSHGVKFYYFQFDATDNHDVYRLQDKKYDVVFLGSCTNQNGRLDILKAINERIRITVFAYDWEEWRMQGFHAFPAVYGAEFNKIVAESKIVLGTSANVECFGYWSNRVGKVLWAGGFLLQWYTPGMELFLADCVEYFSSADEAVEKIYYYLAHPEKVEIFSYKNLQLGAVRWSSAFKIRQLSILMDRFIKDYHGGAWMLP